jgi:RNA polymerase sigma-70 factor, ECF subfamily
VDDAELIRGIANGDAAAFERAYRLHADAVYGCACALVGPSAAAEDLVQEVFLGLIRAAPRLGPGGSLRAYLVQAVRNRDVDRRRSFAARIPTAADDALDREASPSEPPDEIAARGDDRGLVRRALAALPHAQEEAVRLRVVGGLAYDEIALLVAAPAATVRNRYRAGLAKLKDWFEARVRDA